MTTPMTFELLPLQGAEVMTTEIVTAIAVALGTPVQLGPADHVLPVAWRPVAGATGVRVTQGVITVVPVASGDGRELGVGAGAKARQQVIDVTSPEPAAPTRSVVIPQLTRHEGESDIRIGGPAALGSTHRLVVRPVVGGQVQAPVVAVPSLPGKGMRPALLTAASLSGSRLRLPDLPGGRFQISLVTGDTPEDFAPQTISFGDVRVYAAPGPVGLHVHGPDGAELYALGGPLTTTATVDVSAALERHLSGTAENPTGDVVLRVDGQGTAHVAYVVSGVIERRIPGRPEVTVEGEPADLVLPPPDPGRAPTRTVTTLTVTHAGVALHPLSDDAPPATGALAGPVVRDVAVKRELPPQALAGLMLRRVAVVGRPLTECDLTLEVLGRNASRAALPPATGPAPAQVVWFDLGEDVTVDGPVRVALTATRGAFGWVAAPDPLVRFAVATAAAGQTVQVGDLSVSLSAPETVVAAELHGAPPWRVATDQFCTVALAETVLEFAP